MRNRFTRSRVRPAAPTAVALIVLTGGCSTASPPSAEPGPAGTAPLPAPAAEPSTATSAPSMASFTVAQVDRGETEFRAVCGDCHATSEFRGQDFQFTWRRRTAWDFYRLVTSTMPENAPGSLMDEQYVDVIAYVLRMNGFEPGDEELPATQAALDQFIMNQPPKR